VDNLRNVDDMHRSGKLDRPIFSITSTIGAEAWRIGAAYHHVMEIPGRSKEEMPDPKAEGNAWLPVSSTFEYSAMLFLEGIIEVLTAPDRFPDGKTRGDRVRQIVRETPLAIKDELKGKLRENEMVTTELVDRLLHAVERSGPGTLVNKKRVYLFGLGQNNYVIRLFARRIQNIGFEVYVPGPRDIVSKSRPDDIAIFVSNSGKRGTMMRKLERAKKEGCQTIVITADPKAALAEEADVVIPVTTSTTEMHTAAIMDDSGESRQARHVKRTFELAAMFYLEGVSVALMAQLKVTQRELQHVAKEWE
jgi:D-arabinose 5-phosphate isomerase GutQ